MSDERELTPKMRRFCEEYIIDLNGTRAAIRAGYSHNSAQEQASRLLDRPEIQMYVSTLIEARSHRTMITADKVLREYARIAFANMRDFCRFGASGVALKEAEEVSEDDSAAIQEITESTNQHGGTVKIKLHDKKSALDALAKHVGIKGFTAEDLAAALGGEKEGEEKLSGSDIVREIAEKVLEAKK